MKKKTTPIYYLIGGNAIEQFEKSEKAFMKYARKGGNFNIEAFVEGVTDKAKFDLMVSHCCGKIEITKELYNELKKG